MMDEERIRAACEAETRNVTVPNRLWPDILARARRRPRAPRWAPAAAAVALLALLGASPGVQAWTAKNLPMVGQYIARWSEVEKGWAWAERHGQFQEVLAEREDNGYTFRVHRVMADPTQTTIIYTVEGPDAQRATWRPRGDEEILFDGKPFMGGWGGRSEEIDGVAVGSVELDPLPAESGRLTLVVRQLGEVKGKWDVSFPVTRGPLSTLTRTVEAGQTFTLPTGELTVERLVLAPTQTVVELRYHGALHAPDLEGNLLVPGGGESRRRGGGSQGERQSDGNWVQRYQLEFQRLEPTPASATLRLSGRVYRPGETRLPLTGARTATAPDGREVAVEALETRGRHGSATIRFPVDGENLEPFDRIDWRVLDDAGEMHDVWPPGSRNASGVAVPAQPAQTGQVRRQQFEWTLPSGRTAVALVNPGYWEYVEQIGEVTIAIPPSE